MKMNRIRRIAAIAMLASVATAPSVTAEELMSVQEAMSLTGAIEGLHSLLWGVQDLVSFDIGASFDWSFSYSNSGVNLDVFTGDLNGLPLSLSYSGTLTGVYGAEDMVLGGTWIGSLGAQAIIVDDQAHYLLDTISGGYYGMDFYQDGQLDVDEGPPAGGKWFLRGAEVLGGVGVGIFSENWVAGVLTGIALWAVSEAILNRHDLPVRPDMPDVLPAPAPLHTVFIDGTDFSLYMHDLAPTFPMMTDGIWGDGFASGTTTVIPAPSSLALLGLGALAMRRRR